MFTLVFVTLLLLATAGCMAVKLLGPVRDAVHDLPFRVRALLGVQQMADLQRLAAAEVLRRAMVSIDARHLPNEVLVLLSPDDHQRVSNLGSAFCAGVVTLLEAAVRNGGRDEGLPFKLLGEPRVRLKADPGVARGTVGIVSAIAEETDLLPRRDAATPLLMLDLGDRQVPLSGELLVGRAGYADLRIDAAGVSREHAKLKVEGTNLLIRDLGGRNGTTVNDQPVEEARLRPGDSLGFGPNAKGLVVLSRAAVELAEVTTDPLGLGARAV
jgi:hypothetical protein